MSLEHEPVLSECQNLVDVTEAQDTIGASKNTFFQKTKRLLAGFGLAAAVSVPSAIGLEVDSDGSIETPSASADASGYPWPNAPCLSTGNVSGPCHNYDWAVNGNVYDSRGYGYRNCTSYAAWRAAKEFGVNIRGWGHANTWDDNARRAGYAVDVNGPEPGDIAVWDGGTYGHVAFVEGVNSDGSVNISQYNRRGVGEPSTETRRADHYIDINGEGRHWGGSAPAPTPKPPEKIPFSAIADGQEFYSDDGGGFVYTQAGGSAWPLKPRKEWNSGDSYNWGGNPVGPVPVGEIHAREAGFGGYAAHPPRDGTTVYEENIPTQWQFIHGRAYPITLAELDDLQARGRAIKIPQGRLPDFMYGSLNLLNGTPYRFAGRPAVRQFIQHPGEPNDVSYYVNNETVLDCLEQNYGKKVKVLPRSSAPYLTNKPVTDLPNVSTCEYPSGMVLFAPGGIDQWRIKGDNGSRPYTRHHFPTSLVTLLHTSGKPDNRIMRSTQALEGIPIGSPMKTPSGQYFENASTGEVFRAEGDIFRKVPWPNMLSCLGNPSVIKVPGDAVGPLTLGPPMSCMPGENQVVVRPDGRAYHIEAGRARSIANPAIRDCIVGSGAGGPHNLSDKEVDSYPAGSAAPCPFNKNYGMKFVREDGDPTVWFVENDGSLKHAGSVCVTDPDTTLWKQFRVWVVPPGITNSNPKSGVWQADGAKCDALPKVWMG